MARPIKQGLDYFPFDVSFFADRKIKVLKSRFGADGIIIYLYLLTEIYKNGYYLRVDDDFEDVASEDLSMDSNKVKQVLNFLLGRSLFDNTLFQSDKVLTSAGIQRRFQLAVKERARKKSIYIDGFWLLKKEETESFIEVRLNENYSENNESYSRINFDKSEIKYIKESKEKESKEKESKEEERKGEKERPSAAQNIFAYYNQNFGTLGGYALLQNIEHWLTCIDESLIEYAIDEAVIHNKRSWVYVEAILNSHYSAGRKNRADVNLAKGNKDKQSKPVKGGTINATGEHNPYAELESIKL